MDLIFSFEDVFGKMYLIKQRAITDTYVYMSLVVIMVTAYFISHKGRRQIIYT